jgi:ornithine cyclodeaminase/alanine dehydrogenase-like protein (mu-crystallin family)
MSNIPVKIISQEDVAEIFKGNADALFSIIEDAFMKYLHGSVLFPDKISQIFDLSTQNRINCMPATLFGDDMVCGMKWVSVFPTNALKGIQNVTGVMLLSEINTGFPVAVIDGTLATKCELLVLVVSQPNTLHLLRLKP